MSAQWILVADASRARLFSRHSPTDSLVLRVTFSRPESRRKDTRPFARTIAERLQAGLTANEYHTVWLFAPNPFLADLKAEIHDPVDKRVQLAIDVDFTALDLEALEDRLRDPKLGSR